MTSKEKTIYETFGRQCRDGWNGILQPLCDEVERLGGTIHQIKEKFGGLRFHYRLPRGTSDADKEAFAQRVRRAEDESLRTCETCGKPGELIRKEGYLFTACERCRDARHGFQS
jgi:hypothetical protein